MGFFCTLCSIIIGSAAVVSQNVHDDFDIEGEAPNQLFSFYQENEVDLVG